jgi:transposase
VKRYQGEGERGLLDRSSRPQRSPRQVAEQLVRRIEQLRRRRLTGLEIAAELKLAVSTVSLWLRRLGLGRLKNLEPKPVVVRYEKKRPGELVHLDTKKLGRIQGIGHRIHGDRRTRVRGIGFRRAVAAHGARQIYTRPYRPQTNGKAERFIQTAKREWAYRRAYRSSAIRTQMLPSFLNRYNRRRPHRGIGNTTPLSRLEALV